MINRRDFIRTGAAFAGGAALRPPPARAAGEPSESPLALPTPPQLAWQDFEIGLIYHFDITIAAGDTSARNITRKTWDPDVYQPRLLDTDQWIEAAKVCGARYAIFTATHFSGFMQWQSDAYPYGLRQTSWRDGKGDVVADFVTSCRKAGIMPGIYFSVHRNVYQQVWDYYADWGKGRGTPAQEKFNRIAERQMEELCSRYGPLAEIWFDAGAKVPAEGGPDMLPIFEKHQPGAVFYHSTQRADHRWIGNEAGLSANPCWATMPGGQGARSHNSPAWKPLLASGDPDGTAWSPGMVDVPLRGANRIHNWLWAPNQDTGVLPTDALVRIYHNSVGSNCNFIIGEVINRDGLVPDPDIKRLAEFGAAIKRRYGTPVAETSGTGMSLELKLPAASRITSAVLMEDIAHGERIRNYALEGLRPGGGWQELARGQSVGHKRIEQFPAIELTALRWVVTTAKADPRFRKLAAYAAV
jgi:alpha-L-fucosidase